jgi:SOS-response transcriptional repressor LexA
MLTPVIAEPKPLTPKQRAIFEWYFGEMLKSGFQPTIREARERFGWTSTNAVVCHLERIAQKGWMHSCRHSGMNRAIRFLRCPDGTPFLGLVPRTSPLEDHDV